MERFLSLFSLRGHRRRALTALSVHQGLFSCSHIHRDCQFSGRCFLTHPLEAFPNGRVPSEGEIKRMHSLLDRISQPHHLFTVFSRCTDVLPSDELASLKLSPLQSIQEFKSTLYPAARVEEIARPNDGRPPVYLDDAVTAFNLFFPPLPSGDEEFRYAPEITPGGVPIVFVDGDYASSSPLHPFSPEGRGVAQDIIDAIRHRDAEWAPPPVGKRAPLPLCAWVPAAWRDLITAGDSNHFYRQIELAYRHLVKMRSDLKYSRRIILQVFGVRGTLDALHSALDLRENGVTLYAALVCATSISHPDHLLFPSILARTLAYRQAFHLLWTWIHSDRSCQLCFLLAQGIPTAVIADTRAGVFSRDVQISEHMTGVSFPATYAGRVLSRQGSHWIEIQPVSPDDAFHIYLNLTHRYLRAAGVSSRVELEMLRAGMCHVLLDHPLTFHSLIASFRLVLYLEYGLNAEIDLGYHGWTDFGAFKAAIMAPGPKDLVRLEDDLWNAMFQWALAHLSRQGSDGWPFL
nr:non-structural protein 1 [St Croix River virus]